MTTDNEPPVDDGLVGRLREFEISDALGNGDFSVCEEAADTITRLRAAIASSDENVEAYAARMKPTLFVGADGDRGPHIRLERSIVRSLARAVVTAIQEKADGGERTP